MKLFRFRKKYGKSTAIILTLLFLFELGLPTVSYALTSGPSLPEFSSFEPVATTNMVNEFTGDFNYNLPVIEVPGPDGGGYALSLSYHSGVGMEDEASWVGLGWTLNPGAINRSKMGLPDDWNGSQVKYYNKALTNKTLTLGGNLSFEGFSTDPPIPSFNGSVRYNNYRGFGYSTGFEVSVGGGVVSLGFQNTDGESTYSLRVNPAAIGDQGKENSGDQSKELEQNDTQKKMGANSVKKRGRDKDEGGGGGGGMGPLSIYQSLVLQTASRPAATSSYVGNSFRLNIGAQLDPAPAELGLSGDAFGSYSTQTFTALEIQNAYGFMYSHNAWEDDEAIMDYQIERPSNYKKFDKVLPTPYSTPDMFGVSGEGIGGGFRMFSSQTGHFKPSHSESITNFSSGGVDINIGLNMGGGADGSGGTQVLTVGKWHDHNNHPNVEESEATVDEPVFFRFNNDLGGSVQYGEIDNYWERVEFLDMGDGQDVGTVASPLISLNKSLTDGKRSGRSSHIGFTLNKDIVKETESGVKLRSYTKEESIHETIDRNALPDQIGELSVVNENGSRYNYGLPVYSRNEENIFIGRTGSDIVNPSIQNNSIAFADIEGFGGTNIITSDLDFVTGQVANDPYASTFLLTSITTSDYIDRTSNGVTDDDFGGYTKFTYHRKHGDDNKSGGDWYNWRTPYEGMSYKRNSFSDPKDDLMGYASGEKEVMVLQTVETKTHIATFITSEREDGVEAADRRSAAYGVGVGSGAKKLLRLDRIELRSKANNDLIKTVHFKYNYSLCDGVPNNLNGGGKLTLEKVWFEHHGVKNAKIAPYQFEYAYPDFSVSAEYDYANIGEEDAYAVFEGHASFSSGEQNPMYNSQNTDAWGNYQMDGDDRYSQYRTWLNQGDPAAGFDPAAWALKKIILPSGGEIHVQYEQDEYAYVQSEDAHTMVSLNSNSTDAEPLLFDYSTEYYLNMDDLGLSNPADIIKLSQQIYKYYVTDGRKMYFKLLYTLQGWDNPNLDNCTSDYITGYADIQNVIPTTNSIKIEFKHGLNNLPRKICRDFVKTSRRGMLDSSNDCNPAAGGDFFAGSETSMIQQLGSLIQGFNPTQVCLFMNSELSYLRIPLLKDKRVNGDVVGKKGGGIRVKRLLMYDKGINNGGKSLYGSEYIYQTNEVIDGNTVTISSGVATNEPPALKEENPLYTFMERFKQGFVNRAIVGKDRKQMEGPVGEAMLPFPSVGYSRIIVKNIHSGKSHTGYTEMTFKTAKDFPVIDPEVAFSYDKVSTIRNDNDIIPFIPAIVYNFSNQVYRLAQGFLIRLNNMHGQPATRIHYSSNYNENEAGISFSSEEMEYFGLGETIPTVKDPMGIIEHHPLGIEQDITIETKAIKDVTTIVSGEGDIGVNIVGLLFIPGFSLMASYTDINSELKTHVTSKVIRYPSIVKSIKTKQDGVWQKTENLAFDYYTGKPVRTRTYDDFRYQAGSPIETPELELGITHDFSYVSNYFPASSIYEEMGQKASNEKKWIRSNSDFSIKRVNENQLALIPEAGGDPNAICGALNSLAAGDLIQLSPGIDYVSTTTQKDVYHIDTIIGNNLGVLPVSYSTFTPITEDAISFMILKSGKTNQLISSAGSLLRYSEANVDQNLSIPADLDQRLDLVGLLNTLPSVTSADVLNISPPPLNFFFEENCDVFPNLISTHIIDGVLEVRQELTAEDIQAVNFTGYEFELIHHLNTYMTQGLNHSLEIEPADIVLSDCQNATVNQNGFTYTFNMTSDIQELVNYSDEHFDEYIAYVQPHCFIPFSDYCTPIINSNLPFVYNGLEYLNQGLGIQFPIENAEDQYLIISLECDEDNPINSFNIVYGFTDDLNDLSDLERIPFDPELNLGYFAESSDGEPGISFFQNIFQNGIQQSQIEHFLDAPAPEWYLNCGEPTPYTVICSVDLSDPGNGTFALNNEYNVVYYPDGNNCSPVPINCFQFCSEGGSSTLITDAVSCNITMWSHNWPYDESAYPALESVSPSGPIRNSYETGKKGKWRERSNYVYQSETGRISAYEASIEDKNYNSGVFDMVMFDWLNPPLSDNWKKVNTVNKYSPNGNAIEEQDIMYVKSAAKYGYNHTAPYLVAKNSDYASVLFESFESIYEEDTYFEDGFVYDLSTATVEESFAHSGKRSLKLNNHPQGLFLKNTNSNSELVEQGLVARVWVKSNVLNRSGISQRLKLNWYDTDNNLQLSSFFKHIAQSGEWGLFEVTVSSGQVYTETGELFLKYSPGTENETIWIDDIRIQPKNSQTIAYVYDVNTLRLLTVFDDQHFGKYLQYNEEGKLVREIIETDRGLRTVNETQYNMPLINR